MFPKADETVRLACAGVFVSGLVVKGGLGEKATAQLMLANEHPAIDFDRQFKGGRLSI